MTFTKYHVTASFLYTSVLDWMAFCVWDFKLFQFLYNTLWDCSRYINKDGNNCYLHVLQFVSILWLSTYIVPDVYFFLVLFYSRLFWAAIKMNSVSLFKCSCFFVCSSFCFVFCNINAIVFLPIFGLFYPLLFFLSIWLSSFTVNIFQPCQNFVTGFYLLLLSSSMKYFFIST